MPTKKSPAKTKPAAKAKTPTQAESIATAIVAAVNDLPGNDDPPETKEKELSAKEAKKLHRQLVEKRSAERTKAKGGTLATDLFFEAGANQHWLRHKGTFRNFTDKILKSHLIARGVNPYAVVEDQNALDFELFKASDERIVEYAGSIPGYRIGLHEINGHKVLVTKEAAGIWDELPDKIEEPAFFVEFVTTLLGQHKQWEHFFVSSAVSLRTLIRGNDFRPAPFDIFVGEANCGKSLLQLFKTHILGGRSETPAKAMMEGEKFNANLLNAEHWSFGDPPGGTQMRERLAFADRVKEFAHERNFQFRGMHKLGFKFACFRRVDGSFNNQEEDLRKLFPMRSGISDKCSLYLCDDATKVLNRFVQQKPLPGFAVVDGVDGASLEARIKAEAPMIRAWLLTTYPAVPERYRQTRFSTRYGFDPFHHPTLLRELGEFSPENQFMSYVDEILFGVAEGDEGRASWKSGPVNEDAIECTAAELMKVLAVSRFKDVLKDQIKSTGRNLGRMAESTPDRVTKLKFVDGGHQLWKITNPFKTKTTE